jgi:hypothetical protein
MYAMDDLKSLFHEKKSRHLKLFLFSFAHLSDFELFLSREKDFFVNFCDIIIIIYIKDWTL